MGAAEDERRRSAWMLFDYLAQAPLFMPLAAAPADGTEVAPGEPAAAELAVSIDAASGHTAMIACIDKESLAAKFPGARYTRMNAAAVLELFAAGRYDSLFVNPAGKWLALSREQAAEMLAVGRSGPPR